MSNQFLGFSPESFEQFVRALSLEVFGPGVTLFGNGPDGGREATFHGEVPYPFAESTFWNGYGVIQAKCKEKIESTQEEQKWALKQLRDELIKFESNENRVPKPEYYVFVTNVELTSAADGGKDQAEKLIKSFYGRIPLKSHAIWDGNQLNGLIAKYENIRASFTAYLTPGDVLAKIIRKIEGDERNTLQILNSFLERGLREDELSRLEQGGDRTNIGVKLSKLFFDLPASDSPTSTPPNESLQKDGNLPSGVLKEMLVDGSRKLTPETIYEYELKAREKGKHFFPTRYILLGGPGSGKSTVSQFLAQIHRAALILRRPAHLIEPSTKDLADEIKNVCIKEGLPWPATPRFPLRIELNRLAKQLSSSGKDHVKSLGEFISQKIGGETQLNYFDLLNWLEKYPILLILDGLDEVPSSSNRTELVRTVNDFLAQARQLNMDVFVVATSRQQGYTGEFESGIFAYRYILPLSIARALKYVELYAHARFSANDPTRAKDIVDKFASSSKRELMAQLMTSPLQITFMVTVIAAKGEPGQNRWELFSSYYRTIYERESQKSVPPYSFVLSDQKQTIDELHYNIGFWLQFTSEKEGGADSLPSSTFKNYVDKLLAKIGYESEEKEGLVNIIIGAAEDRLVFLTSRVPNELSFGVRSLQEYMAAECIMSGKENEIRERLYSIATSSYWRNVFLFAASKCFADTHSTYLQDSIRLLCEDLNNSTYPALEIICAGSDLALDIVQSGAVSHNPLFRKHLTKLALQIMSTYQVNNSPHEGSPLHYRISSIYSDKYSEAFKSELELYLGQIGLSKSLNAWNVLIQFIKKDIKWSLETAQAFWPQEIHNQTELFDKTFANHPNSRWLKEKFSKIFPQISINHILPKLSFRNRNFQNNFNPNEAVGAVFTLFSYERLYSDNGLRFNDGMATVFKFKLFPLFNLNHELINCFEVLSKVKFTSESWRPLTLAKRFLNSPNKETLADILEQCISDEIVKSKYYFQEILPWPLSSCLMSVENENELKELSILVRNGDFGDEDDWKDFENLLITKGITINEFKQINLNGIKELNRAKYAKRFIIRLNSIIMVEQGNEKHKPIFDAIKEMLPGDDRDHLLGSLLFMLEEEKEAITCIKPLELLAILKESNLTWNQISMPKQENCENMHEWIELFNWVGLSSHLKGLFFRSENDSGWGDEFQDYFLKNITKVKEPTSGETYTYNYLGLFRFLAYMVSSGYVITRLPIHVLKKENFYESELKFFALLLHLSHIHLKAIEAKKLAEDLLGFLRENPLPLYKLMLQRTLETHLESLPEAEDLLVYLLKNLPRENEKLEHSIQNMLGKLMKIQPSKLWSENGIQTLQLPMLDSLKY